MRIEELGRSVVFLTRENQELREQNEIFRQMVVSVFFCSFLVRPGCAPHRCGGDVAMVFK